MNKDWTHPNSHKNANNKNKLRGELEIQMNKFLHVFCDIVNDIPSFEFFSNLFFHQLAKKILFQYFRWFFSGSYGRIYWGDRIGRSRRSETQWPRRRQQGATTCARSRFLLSLPQSFFPVNNEFRFVGASFFFCCHFLGRLRKKHLHFFSAMSLSPKLLASFCCRIPTWCSTNCHLNMTPGWKPWRCKNLGFGLRRFLHGRTWHEGVGRIESGKMVSERVVCQMSSSFVLYKMFCFLLVYSARLFFVFVWHQEQAESLMQISRCLR